MVHFFAADGHYVGAPQEAARFARLLDKAVQAGAGAVSLLGDFFELWIGLSGLEAQWQEDFFAPLAALKQRGIRLRYIVGNKDYFVDDWNARRRLFDEVHALGCVLGSPSGPLHLVHGDLINWHDRQYRLWRAFSRSWPSRALMCGLPRWVLRRLSARVAQGLQKTNRQYKSYFPIEELRARARQLPAGPATLICGHFHQHRELQEGDKRILTLPFLGAENAGILVDENGVRRLEA